MKSLYLFFATILFSLSINAQAQPEKVMATAPTTPVTVEQTVERMCSCAAEHQIPAIAQKYNSASTEETKAKFKSELAIATRQMHSCMNMTEIQLSVRNLPREQRTQFEDAVQKTLIETCPEVSTALQTFR